jgi:F-box-like
MCGESAAKEYRQPTIEILPDDALLEIFDFYRLHAKKVARGQPWKWQCLAHVCRRWRLILSNSPRRLELRIIFKSRTPMKNILDSWPSLPIVIRYTGNKRSKPTAKTLNNILAALHHPDRVCEMDLVVTSSMLESMVGVIQEPFPALESLRFKSIDTSGSPPVLPDTFLCGSTPRLCNIHLDGIAIPFPPLRQLLLSASGLVELRLCSIPSVGVFSPEALVTGLSTLAKLTSFTLQFDSPTPHRPLKSIPSPPQAHVILPSLRSLIFRGASEYFEDLASRMELPVLRFSVVKFFNQLVFEIPQLCRFMGRVDALKSPTEVIVNPTQWSVSISLVRRGERRCNLGEIFMVIPCQQLDGQLSHMAQIFRHPAFSSPLQCEKSYY